MGKSFDCATPLTYTKAKQFVDQGFTSVGRYLGMPGSWKRLSAAEAQAISEAGLYIVSVFERSADRAAKGAAAGAEDGALALTFAHEVRQPVGTPIFAAVDFDTTAADHDAIEAYLRAFDEQIIGYECGVYGEYEVCQAMLDRGVVKRVWQTYAWSRGAKLDNPNMYQYKNDITENDIGIDLDETNGDAGGWKVGMAIQQQPLISIEDANKVIGLLKEAYRQRVTRITLPDETVVNVDQDEIHRLAEIQRAASGQPEEN